MTKTQNVVRWIILGLTTLAFLSAGIFKLIGSEMGVAGFLKWGYPLWFMYFIGACELLGAIGLHMKKVSRAAAICLIILMLGAIGTHVSHHEGLVAPIPATVLTLFLFCILHFDTKKSSAPVSSLL